VAVGLAVVALVAVAAAIAIGPGDGPSSPGRSPDAAAASDDAGLSLVPVVASPVAERPSGPAGTPSSNSPSAIPSASATEVATQEVRARRIRIERLGIDLRVIEGDGVDAPIGKAAHYPGTAWPGGGSNIYIYGHAREGMFLSLWEARVGDVVELDLADGTTRAYVVAKVLPKVPWDAVRYLRPTAGEQLTLQTSTSYHPTSPRFIVIARPAP